MAKLVSIAYPLGDILLLAAAIRLSVDAGKRHPAFYLLASSIVALLVTDFAYGLVTLKGTYDGQLWLDVGWIAFYLLWGAAALHPSMRGLEQAGTGPRRAAQPLRLALLIVRLADRTGHGAAPGDRQRHDLFVVNVAAIILFVPRRRPHGRARTPAGALGGPRAHP